MDPFVDLLGSVRVNGAVLGRSSLSPPCALRFVSGASLTLCAAVGGQGWIVAGDGTRARITAGDSVVVRGPEPFVFTDDPDTVVPEHTMDVSCADGTDSSGATVCALDPDAPTTLMVGEYPITGEVGGRLLATLPSLAFVPADACADGVLDHLVYEITNDRPGRQVVLDRLLDWLLVCTLRAWFDHPDRDVPAWYHALGDAVVGPALRAMHGAPERAWTVAALARSVGVSRAMLARRFTELVGEPPMTYLTGWRMTLAADLLAESTQPVGEVARRVGYADGFGFSAAFTRVKGMNPTSYRAVRGGAREGRNAV